MVLQWALFLMGNSNYFISGLLPNATYYFTCGDYAQGIMSPEHSFTTLPSPSPLNYPARVAVVGDLGLTYNSTTTVDHMLQNDPTLLLMIGDLSYANQYTTTGNSSSCYSCSFPNSPIRETYQPHWDNWQRLESVLCLGSHCAVLLYTSHVEEEEKHLWSWQSPRRVSSTAEKAGVD